MADESDGVYWSELDLIEDDDLDEILGIPMADLLDPQPPVLAPLAPGIIYIFISPEGSRYNTHNLQN